MRDRDGQHWDESRQAWMWNKPDDGTARIADLGAQLADCAKTCGGLEYRLEQAEAALADRDNRRCEDCADHEAEEPCDRFSDAFLAFMRDHCNGKPVSCCFWTARAEEGSKT